MLSILISMNNEVLCSRCKAASYLIYSLQLPALCLPPCPCMHHHHQLHPALSWLLWRWSSTTYTFSQRLATKRCKYHYRHSSNNWGQCSAARIHSLFTWPVLERVSGYNNFLNSSSFANNYIHTKVSDYDFLNIFDKVKLVNLIQTRYCVLTNFPFSLHNPKLSYLLRTLYNCYSLYQLINFI